MRHVALIGCGSYGEVHARAIAALGCARITAFCDTDLARAEQLRAQFGASDALVCDDLASVLADESISVVYIATHHDSHAQLAVRAAEAGRHLFIEKPLAITTADCDRIVAAVEHAGVLAMTGFKFRFQPAVQTLRRLMPRPLLTTAHALDDHWPDAFWANDPVRGGGNVVSEGVHVLDLVAWLHDDEPVRVHAEGGNYGHPDLDIVDNAVVTIRFRRGGIAQVAIGDSGRPPAIGKFALTQTDGVRSAHMDVRLTALRVRMGEEASHAGAAGSGLIEQIDEAEIGVLEESRAFFAALEAGEASPVGVREGRRATRMALAVVESVRTGRTVSLPPDPAFG